MTSVSILGTGNMGQAIARRLNAEGAKVVFGGRHENVLSALAQYLSEQLLAVVTDFTDAPKRVSPPVSRTRSAMRS